MTDKPAAQPLAVIVEDDEKLAVIFTQALKTANFETLTFRDGQEALDQLAKLTPAVVVLDLHLPHVSGADILHQIRQSPHLARTQVILATADPLMADGLQDQSDLVLIKPISFSQLQMLASRLRTQAA